MRGWRRAPGTRWRAWRGETRADDEGARSRDSDVAGFFARKRVRGRQRSSTPAARRTAGRGGGRTFLVGGRFKGEKAPAASDAPSAYLAVYEATFEGLRGGSSSSEGEPPESPAVVWRSVETSGPRPSARRDASVVARCGARSSSSGEETSTRRFLDDAHALDLNTMTWRAIETPEGRPAPQRSTPRACTIRILRIRILLPSSVPPGPLWWFSGARARTLGVSATFGFWTSHTDVVARGRLGPRTGGPRGPRGRSGPRSVLAPRRRREQRERGAGRGDAGPRDDAMARRRGGERPIGGERPLGAVRVVRLGARRRSGRG